MVPFGSQPRITPYETYLLFILRTISARETADATPCMIISSDREHYCYTLYPVKIIRLRNWQTCKPQSLAVPAPRIIFNKTGHVRIAWHCGTIVQPLLQWKSNKISHSECVLVASSIQQAHAPYCHLCPSTRLYHIFPQSHKRHDFREKKKGCRT
jgi:hypothetical protein